MSPIGRHFLLLEIVAVRSSQEKDFAVEFWRTKTGLEVDFVLNRGEVAIIVAARGERRIVDGIEIMPHRDFLEELHGGEIL